MARSLASIGVLGDTAPVGTPVSGSVGGRRSGSGGFLNSLKGIPGRAGEIVKGVPGGIFQLGSDLVRLPYYVGKQIADPHEVGVGEGKIDIGKTFPAVFGVGKGFQETGNRAYSLLPGGTNPSDAWRPYVEDPLGTVINDAANISIVAAPAAKLAGGTGSVGARLGASSASAEAGSMTSRLARATDAVARGADTISSLPTAPYRLPLTRAGEAIGQRTLRGLEYKAGANVEAGAGSQFLADRLPGLRRLAPESKALSDTLLTGKAKETSIEHGALESALPELRTTLEGVTDRAQRSQIIDEWRTGVRSGVQPQLDALRSETAGQLGDLPFNRASTNGFVDEATPPGAQGSLFAEGSARAVLPEGYVHLNDIVTDGNQIKPFKGEENVAIPKPLADQIATFFKGPSKASEQLGKVTGPFNKFKYATSLGWNPAWVTGNAVGNAFMGLSHHPIKFGGEYLRSIRSEHGQGGLPGDSRLFKAAPIEAQVNHLESKIQAGTGNVAAKASNAAVNATDRIGFFRAAERLDNAARSAFYKVELSKGASPNLAMERTLRATGEFDKMSPLERDFIKKLAPFYSWHREILKITKNFAEEHPAAAAQYANLGRESTDGDGGEGTSVGADFLVPFGQAGDKFGGPLFGGPKALGPLPKAIYEAGTGTSAATGKDLRVGQDFGEQNTGGAHNLPEVLRRQVTGTPQGRLTEALRGADEYRTPADGALSFLGVDVSHTPPPKSKKKRGTTGLPVSGTK